jgi:hypothetical protein
VTQKVAVHMSDIVLHRKYRLFRQFSSATSIFLNEIIRRSDTKGTGIGKKFIETLS